MLTLEYKHKYDRPLFATSKVYLSELALELSTLSDTITTTDIYQFSIYMFFCYMS